MTSEKWRVQLSTSHTPYSHVDLKRSHDHVKGYEVVIVDLGSLMTCFESDQVVIPHVTAWKTEKREAIQAFLDPAEGACDMPVVGFTLRTKMHRRLFGLIAPRIEKVPVAGFTNGRHRARYLHFAGATVIPVEVHETEADLLRNTA
jgi:hypothetical protein